MRRLLLLAGALALLAGGGCVPDADKDSDGLLTGAGAALREVGTATIQFDVSLENTVGGDRVHWGGTSRARYGANPASATQFTDFTVRARGTTRVDLEEITVADVRYHRTSRLRTPKGKPWVRLGAGHWLSYGARVADPDLGLIDPMTYLTILDSISAGAAALAETDREQEVDGVPTRAFRLSCALGSRTCPTTDLGRVRRLFSGDNQVDVTFWLDERGLPRRVEGSADLQGQSVLGNTALYHVEFRIDLTDLGRPVEIVEPAANEVTTDVEFVS